VDDFDTAVGRLDRLRHVEGVGMMSSNKKVVIGVVLTVLVVATLVGLVLIDHFGNVIELEVEAIHDEAYSEGYLEGYTEGLEDGAGHGYTVRNPTYNEAILFKATDQTDKNTYDEISYTCTNFAADFKNNAFDVGYRCGLVEIESPSLSHAIVCFDTIDRGLIFIEPQWDDIVTLTIGLSYSELNDYEPLGFDDTIIRYMIVW